MTARERYELYAFRLREIALERENFTSTKIYYPNGWVVRFVR